jgi:DNA polymerase-3 subunit beta
VKFEFTAGTLRLSSSNPDLGEAHEEIDVDFEGEPVTVAFNARYLIDALAVTRAKEVRLILLDSLSPAQLVPTDDVDALAVIMPMRV